MQIGSATTPTPKTQTKLPKQQHGGLEYPEDTVEIARNNRPVVLLHGTLVEKDGISAFRDFALRQGHPVDHRTYPSITKGHRIEKSAELASVQINRSRLEITERNLQQLKGADGDQLGKFFGLDGDLYGKKDRDVKKIASSLPKLVNDVQAIVHQSENLDSTLSGKLKVVQEDLKQSLMSAGIQSEKASKVAAELLDSLAPKAIVVGHSAGGYVGYTLTVNPETAPDNDPYTFDGGNGVGQMVVLSAPIAAGLPTPAPPGIVDLGFYRVDSSVLKPLEQLPASQLMLLNPFFRMGYESMKGLTKQAYHTANLVALSLLNPAIHQVRPGNAQVEENSSFFNANLKDKKVPNDVSVLAVTSPLDQLSQAERSTVDDTQPNAHNFSADLEVSQADIERERPTWAHVIMTEKPDAFQRQFADSLVNNPEQLAKVLDQSNDDGFRYATLELLSERVSTDPTLLSGPLKKAVAKVAAEKAPFKDSPSYLAHQILKG